MRPSAALFAALFLTGLAAPAVELKPQTKKAFDDYVREIEAGMNADVAAKRTRVLERVPAAAAEVTKGEAEAVPFARRTTGRGAGIPVPEGLINHWFGAIFIPGATIADVRAVMSDYASYSRYYAPEVPESRLISHTGDEYEVFLRLFRQVRIKALLGYGFPVEFNANYRIRYDQTSDLLRIRSISTRMAQVRDPKKSHTDEFPVGNDDGYLWALNSYWRVYEGTNRGQRGAFLEGEAVSLSRSVPGFVEKMVTYFTTNFPKDSMEATLRSTRKAVTARVKPAR